MVFEASPLLTVQKYRMSAPAELRVQQCIHLPAGDREKLDRYISNRCQIEGDCVNGLGEFRERLFP